MRRLDRESCGPGSTPAPPTEERLNMDFNDLTNVPPGVTTGVVGFVMWRVLLPLSKAAQGVIDFVAKQEEQDAAVLGKLEAIEKTLGELE